MTRSVRLHGAVTSIRLERRFWAILDEMAACDGVSTPRFLGKLHDEALERHGEVPNFASLLRLACALYLERRATVAASSEVGDGLVAPKRHMAATSKPL